MEHYKGSNEPTMIIFFGDHQPASPRMPTHNVYTHLEKYIDYLQIQIFYLDKL